MKTKANKSNSNQQATNKAMSIEQTKGGKSAKTTTATDYPFKKGDTVQFSQWTDRDGPTDGQLADDDDEAAAKRLVKACRKAGIDENDYGTWAEVEKALTTHEEEEDEGFETVVINGKGKSVNAAKANKTKPAREPSLGKRADGEDKQAQKELTKRAKAVGIDQEEYETWREVEAAVKVAEKEAARPKLVLTKEVNSELNEDGGDAITAAKRLMEKGTYYTLGGVLAKIQREKLHEQVKVGTKYPYQGAQGFKEFCDQYLGSASRKADYLISIYEAFSTAGLTSNKIASIGWSKAKELVAILNAAPDEADKWLATAAKVTIDELKSSIKTRLVKLGARVHGNAKTALVIAFRFSVDEDEAEVVKQAIAAAKATIDEGNDEPSDSQAFAHIMKEWLSLQAQPFRVARHW